MIRFSIITCTYQAASELPKTLESVLHQRYRHVEHIIIDGASTDGTKDIVERYIQANDDNEDCIHRVVFVSEPDKWLYDAMNGKGHGKLCCVS